MNKFCLENIYSKIGKDGSVYIPKSLSIGKSEILLLKRDNDLTFSLYDLNKYKKILEILRLRLVKEMQIEEANRIVLCNNFIDYFSEGIFHEIKVDDNNIVLPEDIIAMYNLDDRLIFNNSKNHVKVFKNDEKLYQYMNGKN